MPEKGGIAPNFRPVSASRNVIPSGVRSRSDPDAQGVVNPTMNRDKVREVARAEGIRPDAYSLDGGDHEDRYVLAIETGGWSVYFVERGERTDVTHFETEEEACDHLLSLLLRDSTTRTGFETYADAERRLSDLNRQRRS